MAVAHKMRCVDYYNGAFSLLDLNSHVHYRKSCIILQNGHNVYTWGWENNRTSIVGSTVLLKTNVDKLKELLKLSGQNLKKRKHKERKQLNKYDTLNIIFSVQSSIVTIQHLHISRLKVLYYTTLSSIQYNKNILYLNCTCGKSRSKSVTIIRSTDLCPADPERVSILLQDGCFNQAYMREVMKIRLGRFFLVSSFCIRIFFLHYTLQQ